MLPQNATFSWPASISFNRIRKRRRPVPEMTPVTSSNILSVGYDPQSREMHVTFSSGATYAYEGVEQGLYERLISADSPGQFLNRHIKNVYSARRT
jgi:hypothetical protein